MDSTMRHTSLRIVVLATPVFALALTACGQSKSPPPDVSVPVAQTNPQDDAAAQSAAAAAQAAEEARAADLTAKERELTERETALKQKEIEAELAKRDAETAAAEAAAAKQAAATQQAAAKRASAAKATTSTAAAPKVAPATPILVPAGTQLAIEMITPLSTKTNKVGDGVDARLASDLVIGDRRAAKAGASVHGSITQVISGSKKIGGTPTLGVTFDSLVANGTSVSINAPFTQLGKSETGKDTAKIVGGAAAGAIIGHQVSSKNGSVVGGILGGAAGTAAAKNTGGEVTLAAGQVVTVATQSSFEARP
jgi:hypothetical protein